MKKLLAVAILSTSVCAPSIGYAQSSYAVQNHYASEGFNTKNDFHPENRQVIKWIFKGVEYAMFAWALYDAWQDLHDWLDKNEGVDNPDVHDPSIKAVCTFYYKYKNTNNLEEMGNILDSNNACI